jgi:hypothetical protein
MGTGGLQAPTVTGTGAPVKSTAVAVQVTPVGVPLTAEQVIEPLTVLPGALTGGNPAMLADTSEEAPNGITAVVSLLPPAVVPPEISLGEPVEPVSVTDVPDGGAK